MSTSVCSEHVPDYAKDGRGLIRGEMQVNGDEPCCVCGEPSLIVLPDIPVYLPGNLRSDGEWPK